MPLTFQQTIVRFTPWRPLIYSCRCGHLPFLNSQASRPSSSSPKSPIREWFSLSWQRTLHHHPRRYSRSSPVSEPEPSASWVQFADAVGNNSQTPEVLLTPTWGMANWNCGEAWFLLISWEGWARSSFIDFFFFFALIKW